MEFFIIWRFPFPDEEEDDDNDTMNMSTYMLEEYSRVTTSLGIVDVYSPDFDLLSNKMRWYAQVEHDGREQQVSMLGTPKIK